MDEFQFFIRFLKDRKAYDAFFMELTEQKGSLYWNKIKQEFQGRTEDIIISTILWLDSVKGCVYWHNLSKGYIKELRENGKFL